MHALICYWAVFQVQHTRTDTLVTQNYCYCTDVILFFLKRRLKRNETKSTENTRVHNVRMKTIPANAIKMFSSNSKRSTIHQQNKVQTLRV